MTSDREQDGALASAMLTVAVVARRLGVAPSTLRTWDRRYGLGPSAHTAGSHRRYSPSDVSRLTVMRGLVMEGVPPGEAAQIALATPVPASDPSDGEELADAVASPLPAAVPSSSAPSHRSGGQAGAAVPPIAPQPVRTDPVVAPVAPVVPASRGAATPEVPARAAWPASPLAARHLVPTLADDAAPELAPGLELGLDEVLTQVLDEALARPGAAAVPAWAGARAGHAPATAHVAPGRAGGGRVISLPDASPRARGLARAAMSLDTYELTRLMREAVGAYGVIGAWDTMIMPVLRGLGDRWVATGEGIDVEHAFSEAMLGVLRGVTATLYRPRNTRPILLACADGDYHSLPLHVLSAALAEVEVGTRMLGVGLPAPALVAAARRTGPAVVFVYARLAVADTGGLRELPRQRPAPRIVLGGPGWEDADLPASAHRVSSLQQAVDEVRGAVQL